MYEYICIKVCVWVRVCVCVHSMCIWCICTCISIFMWVCESEWATHACVCATHCVRVQYELDHIAWVLGQHAHGSARNQLTVVLMTQTYRQATAELCIIMYQYNYVLDQTSYITVINILWKSNQGSISSLSCLSLGFLNSGWGKEVNEGLFLYIVFERLHYLISNS